MRPPFLARVIGAGPTGSLAALALADAGWSVTLEDPLTASQLCDRQRAYAFTHSSQRLLRRLGLWEEVAPVVHPFAELDLADVGCRQGLRFDARDLRDAGPGADAVG